MQVQQVALLRPGREELLRLLVLVAVAEGVSGLQLQQLQQIVGQLVSRRCLGTAACACLPVRMQVLPAEMLPRAFKQWLLKQKREPWQLHA